MNTMKMKNFSEYFTSVDKLTVRGYPHDAGLMHSHYLPFPFPGLVKAKVNECPILRMALNLNFLGLLAGTMFTKMICPGTFALSPGFPFPCPPLSYPSKPLTILLAVPLPTLPPTALLQGATFLRDALTH